MGKKSSLKDVQILTIGQVIDVVRWWDDLGASGEWWMKIDVYPTQPLESRYAASIGRYDPEHPDTVRGEVLCVVAASHVQCLLVLCEQFHHLTEE